MKYLLALIVGVFSAFISCRNSSTQWKCKGNCSYGYGIKTWQDGSYIKGHWKGGMLYGYGVKHWGSSTEHNGDIYVGGFKKDLFEGDGFYNDASMDIKYSGEWRDGKPNGRGKQVFGPHSVNPGGYFIGEMKNGVFEGLGQYYYGKQGTAKGAKYVGHFLSGYKSGLGKFTWPDGRYYEGEWLNDQMNGSGVFTFEDGFHFKGVWTNGQNQEFQTILDQRNAALKRKTKKALSK